MMSFDIIGAHFFLPLFSVRDPTSWGVRLSFLLPPPRTILGALAHSIGVILGIASGEEQLRKEMTRNILTYALETCSFATIRPLSPVIKSSNILRYVPPVEKGERLRSPDTAYDAFKTDIMISGEMKAIFFINTESVSSFFEKYGLPELRVGQFCQAARLIDRIGPTEITCYTKNVEILRIEETSPTTNTYVPYGWLESAEGQYCVSELLPNLRILETLGKIADIDIQTIRHKDLRRKKIPYLLPLKLTKRPKGKEVFEASEVKIKPKRDFATYSLSDGTKAVLPVQKETIPNKGWFQ